ncbi:hypothetical protein [Actinophytocola sp. KF-1]
MRLVAAYVGGLAVTAAVSYGFATSPDARIEHASAPATVFCDRGPQSAEHRSAWFNVHGMTGALYGSATSAGTSVCDPRDAGTVRTASSPSGAKHRSTWFNVH